MNQIHPTCHIETGAQIGHGNSIGPFTYISGNSRIGNNNFIGPHVTIGTPPEHYEFLKEFNSAINLGEVVIDNFNYIWEGVSIQSPTQNLTKIGSNCLLMHNSHVAHDCFLSDGTRLAPSASLGGHVFTGKMVQIGIGAAVHQRMRIRALTLVGMNSAVNLNLKPFSIYAGNPARFLKVNYTGLVRLGIDGSKLNSLANEVKKSFGDWNLNLFPKILLDLLDE